jgi:hypothetical protein
MDHIGRENPRARLPSRPFGHRKHGPILQDARERHLPLRVVLDHEAQRAQHHPAALLAC